MNNKDNKWWQPGLEIFGQITGWIAGPIIISLFLGKYLDNKYGTKPWLFLGLTALAFFITCYGIVKMTTAYIKKIEKEAGEKKDADKNKAN
jgi:F0F1-type ATP synthase assembly protein I